MIDAIIAYLLLTLPVLPPLPESPPCNLTVISKLAVQLEIMDERESRWYFQSEWKRDLETLRTRYDDLYDAPPIADAMRFPNKKYINELIAFNIKYGEWLKEHASIGQLERAWVRVVESERQELYNILDIARDVDSEYYYVQIRRDALRRLRDAIGPHLYYAGCLPPHVPIWRFRRID